MVTICRLLLFDLVLNVTASVAPFHGGDTAAADKLLQRVALGLHWPAEWVRLAGWVACVVGTLGLLAWYLIK